MNFPQIIKSHLHFGTSVNQILEGHYPQQTVFTVRLSEKSNASRQSYANMECSGKV